MPVGPQIPESTTRVMKEVIQLVRMYLRDYPELNRLVAGVESDSRFIAWAINDAIDDWNITPPVLYSVRSVADHPAISLLVRRAAIALLESVAILQIRNHLSYSDGQGATVNASDKAPMLQSMITMLERRYETAKTKVKIAINIEGGWGVGVHSEILFTSGYYGF